MSQTLQKFLEWSARVHCGKNELKGSFTVLIFIGAVPGDSSEWRGSPSYVGGHHVFTSGGYGGRYGGGRQVVEGFIPLNEAIAARSGLDSFEADVVVPYLKRELDWRIQLANGQAVDLKELPSLEVLVQALPISQEPGEAFPKPVGESQQYPDITKGRPGGYNDE